MRRAISLRVLRAEIEDEDLVAVDVGHGAVTHDAEA